MEILQLEESHLDDVVSLWSGAFAEWEPGHRWHPLSRQRLEGIMADENFLPSGSLVAIRDGSLVGFALGYVQRMDFRGEGDLADKPGRIAGLAVRPDCRRQGIGRALLEAVEAALKKEGKSSSSFRTYGMPISLARGFYLDTVPYSFMLSCGYQPLGHELQLRNDLSKFHLSRKIAERRTKLAAEGIIFRWYESDDRDNLLQFMGRYFSGGWCTAIQRATSGEPFRKILLALNSDEIVAFAGPFHVSGIGQPGGFGSPGVSPNFRRRGVGTVLFHLALDYLKSAGASYVEYGTGVTNPARFMYFGSGAQLVGIYCSNLHKKL